MKLKMTLKEADRLAVMKQLDNKKINLRKASKELGISYRQQIRIWQNYQREGPKGLISKRIGKPGNHRLSNNRPLSKLTNPIPNYKFQLSN